VRVGGSVGATRNAVIELAKLGLVAVQPGSAGTPSMFTLLPLQTRRGLRAPSVTLAAS
jgi:hypothetical protein